MIALDTNLLIYAHRAALPEHRAARRAIERASRDARGWGIPLPCVVEFWGVVTHPGCLGGPSTGAQASGFVRALVDAGAAVWGPGEEFWARLMQLAAGLGIQGRRIFDLQIALAAFDPGATEIWTHDRQFTAFPSLRVHDPL